MCLCSQSLRRSQRESFSFNREREREKNRAPLSLWVKNSIDFLTENFNNSSKRNDQYKILDWNNSIANWFHSENDYKIGRF